MKKIAIISFALAGLTLFGSCSKDKEQGFTEKELTFAPVVDQMESPETKSDGNNFFETGYQIDINITTAAKPTAPFVYTYNKSDGIFRGNPPFRFTLDDDYITTLEAVWPAGYNPAAPFITDQRLLENFRKADRLKATGTLTGVMPTNAPVPLHFERQNTMLEFELAGQNTEGLRIKSLLIELQNPAGQAQAYWAYCGTDNGNAQLILPPNTRILAQEGYLIGTLTVVPDDNYTIIFPLTDITLEAGKRYLVTLTPQGYPMNIYCFVGEWNEDPNTGVGIPFQQPTPDVNGTFRIDTPQQLITMSYLIRHYTDGTTFDWPTRTYVISDGLAALMTPELAARYVPIPSAIYPDVKVVDTQEPAQPVATITYGTGQSLALFQ